MKDPSNLRDYASENVLNSMWRTHRILDEKYQKGDLSKIVSNSKHLSNDEQIMLYDVLTKWEFLFDRTLGTWKKIVDKELQPGSKPCHSKPYPVPRSQEAAFRKEVEHLC